MALVGVSLTLQMCYSEHMLRLFAGSSTVKNPTAMQETQVRSMGWDNPLRKGMAAHSSFLGWRIPWTEEPGTTVHRVKIVGHD